MHSTIAWPAPHAKGTAEAHGSALGAEEIAATKTLLGLDPNESFIVPEQTLAHAREVITRGKTAHAEWDSSFKQWQTANPEGASLLKRLRSHELPTGWEKALPEFPSGKDVATRAASGKVINAIATVLPEFWGGSADLAGSNNTTIEGTKSFLPAHSDMKNVDPYGRLIHFGIREHAMGGIVNGIALHGLTKPFGGTFLVFSDYMRGAVRLAALMNIPATFVWTHDSIGLGEDGPTHQPVEHVASLRLIPNFSMIRPADANETVIAWREIIKRAKPAGFALSRQNIPVFDRSIFASAEGVAQGAYVLSDCEGTPDVLLIATGSEVQTSQVVVTPNPSTQIKLEELNKILNEMQQGEEAVKRLAEMDSTRGMQDPATVAAKKMRDSILPKGVQASSSDILGDNAIANNLKQQAERMAAEAKGLLAESARLHKEAAEMLGVQLETAPTEPVKRGRGRPAKAKVVA